MKKSAKPFVQELARTWLDEYRGYSLLYVVWGDHAEVQVVRLIDGQVVQRARAHRCLWTRATAELIREASMSFLKKAAKDDAKALMTVSKEGERFAKTYAALTEYLTAATWEDGTARMPSTLLIFAEDGYYKGCLNDRDASRSLWVAGASIPDVLEALEGHLRAGTGEWRSSGQFKGKKPHKRS